VTEISTITPSAGEIIISLSVGAILSGSLKKLRTRKEIKRAVRESISNLRRANIRVEKNEKKI